MVLPVNLSVSTQVSDVKNNRIANFMEDKHMEQITRVQIQESLDTYVKTYITDAEWHVSLVEDFMHLLTGNSLNMTDLAIPGINTAGELSALISAHRL